MNNVMNRLPVPTWNRCGVNSAPAGAALPAVPAEGFGPALAAEPILPAGFARLDAGFAAFTESGIGAEADAWLAENANSVCHLAVSEGVEINEPAVLSAELDAAHPNALTYVTVDAAKNSRLTLVQVVRGGAESGVSANLTRIRAAEGAVVKLVQVQLLN